MEKILPTLLIIIDVLAALVYAYKSGYWHFVYWIAAGRRTPDIYLDTRGNGSECF